jgi:hypothetical protein
MKWIVGIVLVLFFVSVSADTLLINPQEVSKGGEFSVYGVLEDRQRATVLVSYRGITLIERVVAAGENNTYSLNYKTSFLDPSGVWRVELLDSNVAETLSVSPTSSSSIYQIRVLSPARGAYKRLEKIEISVQIQQDQKFVENLDVRTWGAQGEPITLIESVPGHYRAPYTVPVDADIGVWPFIVTAQSRSIIGDLTGGERVIVLSVESAPVTFDVLQPQQTKVAPLEEIEIRVVPRYSNGILVGDAASVIATIGAEPLQLQQNDNGSYSTTFTPSPEQAGEVVIAITAEDSVGNRGTMRKTVIVDAGIQYTLQQNAVPIGVGVLIVLVLSFLGIRMFFQSGRKGALEKKKAGLEGRLEHVQKEYLSEGTLDRKTFQSKSAQLEAEITHVDRELAKLEGNK